MARLDLDGTVTIPKRLAVRIFGLLAQECAPCANPECQITDNPEQAITECREQLWALLKSTAGVGASDEAQQEPAPGRDPGLVRYAGNGKYVPADGIGGHTNASQDLQIEPLLGSSESVSADGLGMADSCAGSVAGAVTPGVEGCKP